LKILVRIQLILVLSLVFDKGGIVFSIPGILLFENRMAATSILFVAMSMVNLNMAIFKKATWYRWYAVGKPHIDIHGIH
jgi:hypothetical protein